MERDASPGGPAPAIRTRGLTKHFGAVRALEHLDLDVGHGEVFGFLGPNGAGKTTTIRLLLDQLRATRGSAAVLGHDVHAESLAVRARVGYLPGDLALYPKMTGRQLLDYLARLRGGVDPGSVEELAERLGVDLTRRIGEYSSGNRQKVGLIQAFMHRPQVLILDEPSLGLDPLVQQQFHAMVDEVRREGRTVFLSSHTLSEVERVADRVGIIRDGRLVVVERVDELKRKAIRRIDFEFADSVPTGFFRGVPGVRDSSADGAHAQVSYEGSVNPILQRAMTHEVLNLNSREADLEEVFLTYYRDAPAAAPADGTATGGELSGVR